MKNLVIILVFLNFKTFVNAKYLALYDSNFLDVNICKKAEEFDKIILNSNKISIVQFYSSSTCDLCKDFKQQWINFSKETKLWQKYLIYLFKYLIYLFFDLLVFLLSIAV